MIIKLNNYTKKKNKKRILEDLNYTFDSQYVYGLYGHNGSGKTMILRAIAGLIYPTEGEVEIDGQILHKDIDFPQDVGIIIENTKLLPEYTGLQNLEILNQINKKLTIEQMQKSLEIVGLNPDDKRKVKEYSLGMNQKLALAQAIMNEPKLILLDEPTNGLDDDSIELIRTELIRLKEQGSLIIFASHNKDDIRLLADKVIKVNEGNISEIPVEQI